jgi:hypothetical protein
MRAVSLSARTNRGLGELDTMVPGPSLLHRVPSPVPHRVSGPNPHAAVQNAPLFSTNWSGQVLAGGTYTGVGGQWTVPAVQPSGGAQYSATWIGVDGTASSSLIQTGTTQQTVGGVASYFAWVELLPGAAMPIGSAPVSPGDAMQAAVVETATNVWTISIQDTTASWIFSSPFSYTTPGLSTSGSRRHPPSVVVNPRWRTLGPPPSPTCK